MHRQHLRHDILQFCAIPIFPGNQIVSVRQRKQTRLEFPKILAFSPNAAKTLSRDRQHGRKVVFQPVLHFTQQRGMHPLGRLALGDVAGDFRSADDAAVIVPDR